ncbi:unnamed protein product, partial [Rangifer tarandus platyrhynchus]
MAAHGPGSPRRPFFTASLPRPLRESAPPGGVQRRGEELRQVPSPLSWPGSPVSTWWGSVHPSEDRDPPALSHLVPLSPDAGPRPAQGLTAKSTPAPASTPGARPAPDQAPIAYHPFGIKGLDSRPGVDSWTSTSPSLSFHIQGNGDGSNPSEQPLQ